MQEEAPQTASPSEPPDDPRFHATPQGWVMEEPPARRRDLWIPIVLFVLTILSTLLVGVEYSTAYSNNRAPFAEDFGFVRESLREPSLLLTGIPFSFTLLMILGAHELGHYFACRYYGIRASFPYFIPAPTIIGTMGAFIRIRSPIVNRRALFDVGLAGPAVGFLFALPALAIAILFSKVVPAAELQSPLVFGEPLLSRILIALLRPGVSPADLMLHPVGRAAWVGLFATALNLLPAGQLDGGHIVYALSSQNHRRISLGVALALLPMSFFFWPGWGLWGVVLLVFGFRHPMLLDRWERIDGSRRIWAAVALLMFLLCFMPIPLTSAP